MMTQKFITNQKHTPPQNFKTQSNRQTLLQRLNHGECQHACSINGGGGGTYLNISHKTWRQKTMWETQAVDIKMLIIWIIN